MNRKIYIAGMMASASIMPFIASGCTTIKKVADDVCSNEGTIIAGEEVIIKTATNPKLVEAAKAMEIAIEAECPVVPVSASIG